MAIEKKLIHFGKLADFEAQLNAGNILERSIVFIQDAKKIWTHGTYYDCSEGGASEDEFWYVYDITGKLTTDYDTEVLGDLQASRLVTDGIATYDGNGYTTGEQGQVLTADGDGNMHWGDLPENVYITDFTVNDLENAIETESDVVADLTSLEEALEAHKVVLVPYDAEDGYIGYGILVGYAEDLLYFSIYSGNYDGVFYEIETSRGDTFIRDQSISKRTRSDKQDTLVSGTNIKTINGTSLLGSGNIEIESGEANVQSDWNVTDTTSDAYIKNKPTIPSKVSQLTNDKGYLDKTIADKSYTKSETFELSTYAKANGLADYQMAYALPTSANGDEDDIIATKNTLKTINGESIVGSGDIEVGKANYVELSGASVTISSMLENTFYYDTTPLTSLTISAFTSSGNPKDEYKAVFKAADGMSLTLPSDMYWANGTIPEIEANVLYELSIERSLDVYKAVLVPFKSV